MFKLLEIQGYSLYPLFKEGEVVLAIKILPFLKIKTNDIVVFNKESHGLMIKKVRSVKNNEYFVVGENPDSIDSRNFGLLQKKELLYKVLFKVKRA